MPVTIEHPPPEMRLETQPQKVEAGCQQVTPASIAHHLGPSMACMTSTADSSAAQVSCSGQQEVQKEAVEAMAVASLESSLEPGMKMVLVRDIGIQVSGDSPNLNLTRKFKPNSPHHHHHHHHHHQKASSSKQDSLTEKFPAEILF